MTSIEQRLSALERVEWERLHTLPQREWFERGYVSLDRLPAPERAELQSILDAAYDERGYLDHTRLSREQQKRGAELVGRLMEGVAP